MTSPLHRFLHATAILLSALSIAGCNDEKTARENIPDITYALWGAAPEKVSQNAFEIHDRTGAVIKRLRVEVTPHIVNDCSATGDLSFEIEDTATGKVISEKNTMTVNIGKAQSLTFESVIQPQEAVLFQDPNTKPPFTPKKILVTKITGLFPACIENQGCVRSTDPFFMFGNPNIRGESLVEAFRRVKAKCPSR